MLVKSGVTLKALNNPGFFASVTFSVIRVTSAAARSVCSFVNLFTGGLTCFGALVASLSASLSRFSFSFSCMRLFVVNIKKPTTREPNRVSKSETLVPLPNRPILRYCSNSRRLSLITDANPLRAVFTANGAVVASTVLYTFAGLSTSSGLYLAISTFICFRHATLYCSIRFAS